MTGIGVWQQLVIGILAGLIVLLIAKLIDLIFEHISGHKILKSRKSKILLIALVAIVVLIVYCCYPLPDGPQIQITDRKDPQIQITDPKEGDYVTRRYSVKGTSNINPNSGLNIYVFIYARDWYAQPKAIITSNGDWETKDKCKFGKPEYLGLNYTYEICAIVTREDFKVDEQFQVLPDYINKSDTITVTRE
jgi:hypothetical protein